MEKNKRKRALVGQRYLHVAPWRNVVAVSTDAIAVPHWHIVTVALWRTAARSGALHRFAATFGT